MKKNFLWISLIVLLILSVLSGLSVNTTKVSAVDYPAIYIDPPSIIEDYEDLPIGSNFTISIKTDCTQDDITGWQFTLSYDPSLLNGGINRTDMWTGDGSNKTFRLTGDPVALDSVKVYVNQTLVTEQMEGYDMWIGDGDKAVFTTTNKPIVEESEEVKVNGSLQTRRTIGNTTWIGDGLNKTFFTTDKPVVEFSETIKMNFTDTWIAPHPNQNKYSYNTTGKPVIYPSEEVTVDGVLQTKDVDYIIHYGEGNITFTYLPARDSVIVAKYEALRTRDTDYTIDYLTGNMTFADAPAVNTIIEAEYWYGHYTLTWDTGILTFEKETIGAPGVGAIINATYEYEHHTVDYVDGTVTFSTAPGVGADIKVIYLYGGVTNGDLIPDVYPGTFLSGAFNNTEGTLSTTAGLFQYVFPPPDVTTGPGTLANVTFRVVGYGCCDITLGNLTKLVGWSGGKYDIINAETMPTHIQHGYFRNKLTGDANGDTIVDIDDILKIKYHRSGPPPGPGGYERNVDINDDTYIDIDDILLVKANRGRSVVLP